MNIKKIKIFNNGSWVEYALDGTTIDNAANLEVGSKPGSTQTKDAIWNGGTQKDEENIIRIQDGDTVEGAIAEGFQSAAFGGKRYDKVRKNDEIDTSRKPTSAEGNQSFAAGASVHAHGDFSVAFGKDNDAHQRGGFVTGGGCRVGMTEEEFNAFYWDDVNNKPLNDGKGKNDDGKITDFENKSYEQSYSFGFTSGTINKALGRDSFATGMGSKALGSESFAAGSQTYAIGSMSAAFGIGVYDSEIGEYGIRGATGKCSFVAGRSANATGDFSQAFGYFTQATGSSSFAAGNNTEATGNASVSLGNGTKAIGDGSVALGYNSQAKGLHSFAMGDENTIVEGNYSSAFGRGLRTSPKNNSGQHIIGKWNDLNYLELMAFAVGAGSDDNNRKNLLSLYNDGRLRLPNITETLTDNDVTRLKDVKEVVNTEKTEREAADTEINNIVNTKADKTYVDNLVSTEIAKVIDSAPEAFDTLKEVANWIENDQTGAAAMANEISKHNDILNGFGEENEPSNIKVYIDEAVENINTNLEDTIASLDEEGIKLKSDLYTYASIGKISSASDSNPVKVASAGESLKSVFNAIFGEPKDVQPTINVSGVSLSVDPKTKGYSGGELGTKLGSDTIDITFTFTNIATNNFGCIIGGVKHPDVKTFKYAVNKQNQKDRDIKIIMPNDKFNIDAKYAAIREGNNIYCNLVDNKVVVTVDLDEIPSSSNNQIRYPSVKAIVDLGNAINNDGETISAFLTFQGNEATDTSKLAMADKEVSTNDYTISAGSKYTYYATTTSTNEPTSWEKYGSGTTSVTDLTIPAKAGEYIWIASASSYASIYAFNEVSGKYNTDKTATTKTSNKTLVNSQGATVGEYYFYRTTNPMSLASENKYKLGN